MKVWTLFDKQEPDLYTRLDVKDKRGRKYIGFYIGNKIFLETKGKKVIKNVNKWKIYEGKEKIFDEEYRYQER